MNLTKMFCLLFLLGQKKNKKNKGTGKCTGEGTGPEIYDAEILQIKGFNRRLSNQNDAIQVDGSDFNRRSPLFANSHVYMTSCARGCQHHA